MTKASHYLSQPLPYQGVDAPGFRFPVHMRMTQLVQHLRLRSFPGSLTEDTLQCYVFDWQTTEGLTVVFSPAPGFPAVVLSQEYVRIAYCHAIELISKRKMPLIGTVQWLQHYPARTGAPLPYAEDYFEEIDITLWDWSFSATKPSRFRMSPQDALLTLR